MGAFRTHHSFKRIQTELAVNLCPSRHQVRRGASIFPFLLLIDNTTPTWFIQYLFFKKIKSNKSTYTHKWWTLGDSNPRPTD